MAPLISQKVLHALGQTASDVEIPCNLHPSARSSMAGNFSKTWWLQMVFIIIKMEALCLTLYVWYLKELESAWVHWDFRTVSHSCDVLKLRVSANIQCLASVLLVSEQRDASKHIQQHCTVCEMRCIWSEWSSIYIQRWWRGCTHPGSPHLTSPTIIALL